MQKIILASGSKNRQRLLKTLGIPFKVIVSNFDEAKIKEKNPEIRARKIALAKAEKVADSCRGIIIACDTFTACQGEILEKPKDLVEARLMLKKLSANKAVCYTGFCFISDKAKVFSKTAITKVSFRQFFKSEIEEFVSIFPVTEWAAAYAPSKAYVMGMIKSLSGSLTGLTHGLPIEFLIPLLRESGYKPKPV